ncbi:MAG: ABC-2 family transporter protein [Myxococcota bacterium]
MNAKYLYMVRVSARQRLAERGALLGRAGYYALVLYVFSKIWEAVLADQSLDFAEPHQLVWYLAITEWIILSIPALHLEVEDEVRQGDLAYRLARPVAYPLAKIAEGVGNLVVRLAAMAPLGFGVAYALTGQLPTEPANLLWLLPLGLLAGVLWTLNMFAVGLSSFWLHQCKPIYWIWQKSAFVLGGLFLPLDVYPDGLRQFGEWTPFAAVLYRPGTLALGAETADALFTMALLLGWIAVCGLVTAVLYRRALARLELSGG